MSTARIDIEGASVSPDHYIGGRRVSSALTFEDHSPLDWSLKLGDFARGHAVAAEQAVTAAAFPDWSATGISERAACMHRLAELVDANVTSIARLECLDTAMLHENLELRVIPWGARNFRAYADLACEYEGRTLSSNGTVNAIQRMPAGPAVIITPWNAPFMLSTWKCAPALAGDNTVILKPAEWSPVTASVLADPVDETGFPHGVFNIVQGIGEEVGASVRDEFLERMLAYTDEHVLGDSRVPETTVSPVIHPDHLARVHGFVERARVAGDRVLRGGHVARDGGLWYEPTLVQPRSNDSEIVQNEVFGPVLTLQTFEDEAQAVALANGTRYGLAGIVYMGDETRAQRIGRAVRAGTVWVNCFVIRDLTAPFGGCGINGGGREGGDYALDFHSDLKTLQILEGSTG